MAPVSAACVVTTILVCAAGVHAKAVLQLALSNQLNTHTHPSVGPQRNDIWSQTDERYCATLGTFLGCYNVSVSSVASDSFL